MESTQFFFSKEYFWTWHALSTSFQLDIRDKYPYKSNPWIGRLPKHWKTVGRHNDLLTNLHESMVYICSSVFGRIFSHQISLSFWTKNPKMGSFRIRSSVRLLFLKGEPRVVQNPTAEDFFGFFRVRDVTIFHVWFPPNQKRGLKMNKIF